MSYNRQQIEELLEQANFTELHFKYLNPELDYEEGEITNELADVMLKHDANIIIEHLLYKLIFAPQTTNIRHNNTLAVEGIIDREILHKVLAPDEVARIRRNVKSLKMTGVETWSPFKEKSVKSVGSSNAFSLSDLKKIKEEREEKKDEERRAKLEIEQMRMIAEQQKALEAKEMFKRRRAVNG